MTRNEATEETLEVGCFTAQEEPNIQLAENEEVELEEETLDKESKKSDYQKKRELLEITKINKQIWSIKELYQKIGSRKLILNPEYQRREVWKRDKQIPFIESLFMGITIPPIYVVEIPPVHFLDEMEYEVVDGKQRLTTIHKFISNQLVLEEKYLEYYGDIFDKLCFEDIKRDNHEVLSELLSSVLDVYVISANSPEFTKYDIFSRLNKGAQSLRTNEIRKAIYRSKVVEQLEQYIEPRVNSNDQEYFELFSKLMRERYEDYGIFFGAITYYLKVDEDKCIVVDYNSRPRELINKVLGELQGSCEIISQQEVATIIEKTIYLKKQLKAVDYDKYLLDSMIYFAVKNFDLLEPKIEAIIKDEVIQETFKKSPATTTNVNARIKRIKEIIYV